MHSTDSRQVCNKLVDFPSLLVLWLVMFFFTTFPILLVAVILPSTFASDKGILWYGPS